MGLLCFWVCVQALGQRRCRQRRSALKRSASASPSALKVRHFGASLAPSLESLRKGALVNDIRFRNNKSAHALRRSKLRFFAPSEILCSNLLSGEVVDNFFKPVVTLLRPHFLRTADAGAKQWAAAAKAVPSGVETKTRRRRPVGTRRRGRPSCAALRELAVVWTRQRSPFLSVQCTLEETPPDSVFSGENAAHLNSRMYHRFGPSTSLSCTWHFCL